MNQVFILYGGTYYEGREVLRVCSSKERAEAFRDEHEAKQGQNIDGVFWSTFDYFDIEPQKVEH